MNKSVLITGATGFVGGHTAEAYLRAGWRVTILVRDPGRAGWLAELGATVVTGDITQPAVVKSALDEIHCVVHCAGLTKARTVGDYYRVNAVATETLIQAACVAGVQKFVHCSTLAVSGPATPENPATESDIPVPITDYGKSKLAGEEAVRSAGNRIQWVIIRPPAVMGPRDEQFLPLFRAMHRWRIYPVFGDGSQRYSMIYVLDLANLLVICGTMESNFAETFFTANDESLNWTEAAQVISSVMGHKLRALKIPKFAAVSASFIAEFAASIERKPALLSRQKLREILSPGWVCSPAKLRTRLGFSCQFSNRDMLSETYAHYLRAGRL